MEAKTRELVVSDDYILNFGAADGLCSVVGEWNWDIANCLLSDPRRNLTGLVIEGMIGHKDGH